MRASLLVGTVLLLVAAPVGAQTAPIDSLFARPTAQALHRLLDSAATLRLPLDGLVSTALEGRMRKVGDERILGAVRAQLGALATARQALGGTVSPAELSAAASALLGGVRAAQLAALPDVRPRGKLLTPLVVLSDLVARGVPADTAVRVLYIGLARGLSDDELSRWRQAVERDITSGAAPAAAAILRLRNEPRVGPTAVERLWPIPPSQEFP